MYFDTLMILDGYPLGITIIKNIIPDGYHSSTYLLDITVKKVLKINRRRKCSE
jgi:hypothetical protein